MRRILFITFVVSFLLCMALPCYAMEEFSQTPAISEEELGTAVEEEVQGWLDTMVSYTPEEWREFVSEKIVPWVTLAVSAVVAMIAALIPLIRKIKGTSDIFEGAADKLQEATKKSKEAREAADGARDKVMEEYESLKKEFGAVKDGYNGMRESLSNIEAILKIAFENTDELIRKGYANQIAKVGKDDVKEDEET